MPRSSDGVCGVDGNGSSGACCECSLGKLCNSAELLGQWYEHDIERRIRREIEELSRNNPSFIVRKPLVHLCSTSVEVIDSCCRGSDSSRRDIFSQEIVVIPSKDSLYASGEFLMLIVYSEDYPHEPFRVQVLTKIYSYKVADGGNFDNFYSPQSVFGGSKWARSLTLTRVLSEYRDSIFMDGSAGADVGTSNSGGGAVGGKDSKRLHQKMMRTSIDSFSLDRYLVYKTDRVLYYDNARLWTSWFAKGSKSPDKKHIQKLAAARNAMGISAGIGIGRDGELLNVIYNYDEESRTIIKYTESLSDEVEEEEDSLPQCVLLNFSPGRIENCTWLPAVE